MPTKQVTLCACTSWPSFFSSPGAMKFWKTGNERPQREGGKQILFFIFSQKYHCPLPVLTLSVTVAMIRAFGTRRAVLVFFRSVTDSTGILIWNKINVALKSQYSHTNLHHALSWGASPPTGISQTFNTHLLKMSPLHFWLLLFHVK